MTVALESERETGYRVKEFPSATWGASGVALSVWGVGVLGSERVMDDSALRDLDEASRPN